MAYRSSTTANGTEPNYITGSGDVTINAPSGLAEDDIVILAFNTDNTQASPSDGEGPVQSISWPSNGMETAFTQLEIDHHDWGHDGQSLAIAWGRVGSSVPESWTITWEKYYLWPGTYVVVAVAFSGRATDSGPSSTENSISEASANASPQDIVATGLTAVAGDDLCMVSGLDMDSVGSMSCAIPSGMSEAEDTYFSQACLAVHTEDNVSGGSTGNKTCEYTHSGDAVWTSFLVAIPSASAPPAAVLHMLPLLGVGK